MKTTRLFRICAVAAMLAGCGTSDRGSSTSKGTGTGGGGGDIVESTSDDDTGDDTGTGDTSDTSGTTTGGTTDTGSDCTPACVSPQECIDGACKLPTLCQPFTWVCEGLVGKKQCNEEGTGFLDPEPCPGDQYCTSGQCGLKCSLDPKWGAYVGCVFWTVDLPVWDDPTLPNANTLPHAVVVSNPSELDATVEFTPPPGVNFNFADLTVPGSGSRVFEFPYPELATEGSDITDVGVRIESDRPVLVHQFNPWDNTYSNDASLLLPEPLLGQEHLILSWPTDPRCLIEIPGLPNFGGPCSHSFLSVVAPTDNTEVTVRASARVAGTVIPEGMEGQIEPTVDPMPPGAIQTFTLNKGQVLNLDAMPETIFETADLTGSLVLSNKPIAVFSGHDSAAVSAPGGGGGTGDPGEDSGSCCLDHLEEQMIPVSLLGTHYVAAKSASRGGEKDLWRLIAADDNVTITTTPPIEGLNGQTLAKKGEWIEAYTTESFDIQATGRIQVGQYLVSQEDTQDVTGDPSLILAIPVERYRSTYPIMVPPLYAKNYVSVVRSPGTPIQVDGAPVADGEFTPVAGSWEIAWILLSEGFHTVTGDAPFSLSAYGYNTAASYGYPGGMTIPGEANP